MLINSTAAKCHTQVTPRLHTIAQFWRLSHPLESLPPVQAGSSMQEARFASFAAHCCCQRLRHHRKIQMNLAHKSIYTTGEDCHSHDAIWLIYCKALFYVKLFVPASWHKPLRLAASGFGL